RLVSANYDTTAVVWDVSLTAAARGRNPASDADLESAWKTLGETNAVRAWDALITFASASDRAVALLRPRVRAPARLDAATIDRLVEDLSSDSFHVRTQATEQLEKRGRSFVSELTARAAAA